jgi:hypothetical protein
MSPEKYRVLVQTNNCETFGSDKAGSDTSSMAEVGTGEFTNPEGRDTKKVFSGS